MPIILSPTDAYRLHDPLNSALNIPIRLINPPLSSNVREEQAAFNPLGRKNIIIVRDVIRGEHWTLHIEFLTQAEYDAFKAIRANQRTLILMEVWTSHSWYVALGEMMEVELYNYGTNTYRHISVTADEQDVPS